MDQIDKWSMIFTAPDPSSALTSSLSTASKHTRFRPNIKASLASQAVKLIIRHDKHVIFDFLSHMKELLGDQNFTPYPSLDQGSHCSPAVKFKSSKKLVFIISGSLHQTLSFCMILS